MLEVLQSSRLKRAERIRAADEVPTLLSGSAVQLFEEDILEDLPSAELAKDALVEHPSSKSEVVTET